MDAAAVVNLANVTTLYAELVSELEEVLEGASLVLPDNEHFPDTVNASPEGVEILFERVLSYTPVPADTAFVLQFLAPDEEAGGGGCSSGACGGKGATPAALAELGADDTWRVTIPVQDTGNPVRLMSQLARAAGDMLTQIAERTPPATERQRLVQAEVAAIACGLGPLLLGASHLVQKGCGGLNVYEGTTLPTATLAGLTALFAEQHDETAKLGRLQRLLQPTPAEALELARTFFRQRPAFVQELRDTPERVAFHCDFGAEQGLLDRWFGKRGAPALRPS